MSIEIHDTRTLMGVYSTDVPVPSFFLDRYFPMMMMFDDELIDFDEIAVDDKKLAPFVMPTAAGRPVASRGHVTKTFKPAYVKPKHNINPSRAFKRRAGEPIGGVLSPAQRRDAHITETLLDHRRMIRRRKEFMAAELLNTGQITVKGENYPEQVVNFGRDAQLTVQLAGAARWGEAGVNPLDDLETWSGLMSTIGGAAGVEVVMDPLAYQQFRASADVKALLDVRRAPDVVGINVGPVARDPRVSQVRFVGSIGDLDFFLYNDDAMEEDGTTVKLLPDHGLVMLPRGLDGVQAHGAIMDPRSGLQPLEFFPTNWIENDPTVEFVMTQSAPLPVLPQINRSFAATVR